MGWVVCEMTGHANKLHHFWLSGQGQCHAICQSGGLWVKGWMGLISMCSLRSLTPPPPPPQKPPNSKLSVTTTLTPKKPCRETALASGATQTYELTHQPLAKNQNIQRLISMHGWALRSVIVPAVDRVITATHTASLFPQIIFFTQETSFLLNFVLILNRLSSFYLLCIYFIFTFYFLFNVYLLLPQHLFCIIIICVSTFRLVFTVYQFCVYFPLFIYFVLSFLCLFCIFSPITFMYLVPMLHPLFTLYLLAI